MMNEAKKSVAVVTGAGSGVGRAVALQLAAKGWIVVLVGRGEAALRGTVELAAKEAASRMQVQAGDVADAPAVKRAAETAQKLGHVDVLVNAAGVNVPRRSLAELSLEDYRKTLGVNLDGVYLMVQAFLPGMRQRGTGTIVNVISDAGKAASPKAGAAYATSKFGLTGLTQSINAEERGHGIRATGIFPGDIDTPLLENRPVPPTAEARTKMLQSEDVAACVMLAIELPMRAIVEELVVRPR